MDEMWDEQEETKTTTSSFASNGVTPGTSSWNSGAGGGGDQNGNTRGFYSSGRGRGGRGSGGFKSFSSDGEGSSWNSGGGGGGFQGRGAGGRSFRNESGDGDQDGGSRGRGGRGGFRDGEGSSWNSGGGGGGFQGRGAGGRSFRNESGDGDQDGGSRGRGGRGGFRGGSQGEGGGFGGGASAGDHDNAGEGARPKVTYVPPPLAEDEASIFFHCGSGINFSKYDDILVNVSGTDPPRPISTFEEACMCPSLKRNVEKSGYVKPTPVQKHGIPIIVAGRDLMACAQTGSGKTAAFLFPILQKLMASGAAASSFSEQQEPEAIIVAPTRELIHQIYLEARKFAHGTCVRPAVAYGGIDTAHQIRDLMRGCNVLCGTPGRLLDVIRRGKVGLTKLQFLVMDEADRMLDMGFETDMRTLVGSPGITPIEERQTLMFSATYPEGIQRLAADFLRKDYLFLAVGVVGGACADVEQMLVQVTKFSKREQLLEVLKTTGVERTMVFVETKRQADFIAAFLCQENVATTSIHGDREQREREQALGDFRSGKCPVLVATSVAARGLDIPDVQYVVNFDLPNNIDEYVHRIGRTARCGNTGRAMSFYDPEADKPLARSLVKILASAQQEVPSWLEESALGAHGTTGFSPQVFASTDSRQHGGFQAAANGPGQPAAQPGAAAEEEEEEAWE